MGKRSKRRFKGPCCRKKTSDSDVEEAASDQYDSQKCRVEGQVNSKVEVKVKQRPRKLPIEEEAKLQMSELDKRLSTSMRDLFSKIDQHSNTDVEILNKVLPKQLHVAGVKSERADWSAGQSDIVRPLENRPRVVQLKLSIPEDNNDDRLVRLSLVKPEENIVNDSYDSDTGSSYVEKSTSSSTADTIVSVASKCVGLDIPFTNEEYTKDGCVTNKHSVKAIPQLASTQVDAIRSMPDENFKVDEVKVPTSMMDKFIQVRPEVVSIACGTTELAESSTPKAVLKDAGVQVSNLEPMVLRSFSTRFSSVPAMLLDTELSHVAITRMKFACGTVIERAGKENLLTEFDPKEIWNFTPFDIYCKRMSVPVLQHKGSSPFKFMNAKHSSKSRLSRFSLTIPPAESSVTIKKITDDTLSKLEKTSSTIVSDQIMEPDIVMPTKPKVIHKEQKPADTEVECLRNQGDTQRIECVSSGAAKVEKGMDAVDDVGLKTDNPNKHDQIDKMELLSGSRKDGKGESINEAFNTDGFQVPNLRLLCKNMFMETPSYGGSAQSAISCPKLSSVALRYIEVAYQRFKTKARIEKKEYTSVQSLRDICGQLLGVNTKVRQGSLRDEIKKDKAININKGNELKKDKGIYQKVLCSPKKDADFNIDYGHEIEKDEEITVEICLDPKKDISIDFEKEFEIDINIENGKEPMNGVDKDIKQEINICADAHIVKDPVQNKPDIHIDVGHEEIHINKDNADVNLASMDKAVQGTFGATANLIQRMTHADLKVKELKEDAPNDLVQFRTRIPELQYAPKTPLSNIGFTVNLRDLMEKYKDSGVFTELHAQFLCINILRKLKAFHSQGIIHASITPRRVVFNAAGYPTLIPDIPIPTRKIKPRIEYSTPEHISSDPITMATDIFQTGLLVYTVFTGKSPYLAETREQTKENLLNGDFTPELDPDRISKDGRYFVRKCLKKNPDLRFKLVKCRKSLDKAVKWFSNFKEETLANQTFPSPFKDLVMAQLT